MPLDFFGLEEWEGWLRGAHPEQYDRLLVYDEPFERVFDDVSFWSNILRYDPAVVEEIRMSIEEYLDSR